ncbi:MAG: hypothetical protein RPR91_07695 [Colwellia sp.]
MSAHQGNHEISSPLIIRTVAAHLAGLDNAVAVERFLSIWN